MHVAHGRVQPVDRLGVELGGGGEGRQLRPVADLVGQAPAQARQDVLVPQPAVQAHGVLGEQAAEVVPAEGVGFGAEVVERGPALGSAVHHPHAGLALGAGLGEQEGPAVGEGPAGLAAPGLGRLLGVLLEAAALHEVDDERHRLEPQQQVLAPAPHLLERVALRRLRRGRGGLEGGEGQRPEARQVGPGVGLREPLGVGLDLGHLGHGGPPSTSSPPGPGPGRRAPRPGPAGGR